MGESTDHPRPLLIVVTGRPGAGKTTLASLLATTIRCPVVGRDAIKEGYVNTTGASGSPGDEIARTIYEAFFDVVSLLLSRRVTLVAEAAFQHKVWAPKLAHFTDVARVRLVICSIDAKLARTRQVERGLADPIREQFHCDEYSQAAREGRELPVGDYDPPHLDVPTLAVNTTNGYEPSLESVVSFVLA
jgi:predicted kinase